MARAALWAPLVSPNLPHMVLPARKAPADGQNSAPGIPGGPPHREFQGVLRLRHREFKELPRRTGAKRSEGWHVENWSTG
eukprot:9356521-Pyramimonas_sp.AAC.1